MTSYICGCLDPDFVKPPVETKTKDCPECKEYCKTIYKYPNDDPGYACVLEEDSDKKKSASLTKILVYTAIILFILLIIFLLLRKTKKRRYTKK